MRPRCFCSSLPAGLLFGVFVFLLRPVSTQKIRNQIYFLDNEGDIVLKGPDNPGSDIVVWEWEPHSGPGKQTVVTLRVVAKNNDMWSRQWGKGWGNAGKNQEVDVDLRTGNLAITKARFKWSGLFTLTETHPRNQILKQYEIYGIKVEASPQNPLLGSDVTLSCTISRLSDTVSLHWRPMDSSQQNRSNTDQIRLDNTVYLMFRHVTVEDGKLYVCDVRENGNIVHTSNGDFTVDTNLHEGRYTLYRSSTDHSELHLVCSSYGDGYSRAEWAWAPPHVHQQKVIASAERSQPINVKGTDFRNRLVTSGKPFDGKDFSVRIVPVLFQDAGIYMCFLESNRFSTIDLITVKVTAEPSDAVTEGDTVTLTCSVSHVIESMRLVWINGDGKSVGEKTLTVEEKSQSLVIQKAERGRGNWRCGLFHQDLPRLFVPYYLEPREIRNQIYFLDNEGDIVLKGPDNPGSATVVWEWEPHSGPGKQTVVTLRLQDKDKGTWSRQWGNDWGNAGKNQEVDVDLRTGNLAIKKPRFKWSGLFTLTETQPRNRILKQYEIYGIKVEASPQNPLLGSDVILSCTISRLSDTVSLHWRPMDSSQQNRSNTDQIRLDNTVYLMVRHVTVEDGKLYVCDVRENGNIVHTSNGDFTVNTRNHNFTFRFVVFIGGLAVLLVIILAVEFWQRKRKPTGLGNQRQPTPPSKRNTEGESHLYGNVEEIRQVAEGEGEDGRVDEEP